MIANKADTNFVPNPTISARPPMSSIKATIYAIKPGIPILSNQPTVFQFHLEISLIHG